MIRKEGTAIICAIIILGMTLFASGCLDSNALDTGEVRIVNVDGKDDFGYDPVVYATIENTYSSSKEVEVRFQVITERDTYSDTKTIVVPGETTNTYSCKISRTPLETTQRYEASILSYS